MSFDIHGDEVLREEHSPSCFCKEVGVKIKIAIISPTNTKNRCSSRTLKSRI